MSRKKQIKNLRHEIKELNQRIQELDFWFLRNLTSADWTEKMNQYWVLQARVQEKTEQRNRLTAGKDALKPARHEVQIPRNVNTRN